MWIIASKQHLQWTSDSNKSFPVHSLAWFTHSTAVHCAAAWMSRFLPAEFCRDIENNEHCSEIDARNSVKTAEHVALCQWSFCMPSCTSRCSYVLRFTMASQNALHRSRIGVRKPSQTGRRHHKIMRIIYCFSNNSIIEKTIAYKILAWFNSA